MTSPRTAKLNRVAPILASSVAAISLAVFAAVPQAMWSKKATPLLYTSGSTSKPGKRQVQVVSPDKKKLLIVQGAALEVVVDGKRLPGANRFGLPPLAEVVWSPDSRAFAITWSDGGDVGTWRVNVFWIGQNAVRYTDPTPQVQTEFMGTYRCAGSTNQVPNIAALDWANGSADLLLVAQVPPDSSCRQMGRIDGYLVAARTGAILGRYSQEQFLKRWGNLVSVQGYEN